MPATPPLRLPGRTASAWVVVLATALAAGCASAPRPADGRDGAEAAPPSGLDNVPDAEPRVEPIRPGGANKPYSALGRSYSPRLSDEPLVEHGLASWYGRKYHGRPTASGEIYDMYAMTAAHKTMPLPSYARVRNPANGREVIVRVNDRGPFDDGRVIDLSYTAALKLGVLRGVAPVQVERLTNEQIRSGSWRRDGETAVTPVALAALPAAQAPSDAEALRPSSSGAPGFWLQLGAFREREGALGFRRQVLRDLAELAPLLTVFDDRNLYRLHAGPYASRAEAASAAERIRATLQLVPLLLERR